MPLASPTPHTIVLAVMEIDTQGTFNASRAAFPELEKSGDAAIVNISATLQYGATWYQAHASAAKVFAQPHAVDCFWMVEQLDVSLPHFNFASTAKPVLVVGMVLGRPTFFLTLGLHELIAVFDCMTLLLWVALTKSARALPRKTAAPTSFNLTVLLECKCLEQLSAQQLRSALPCDIGL